MAVSKNDKITQEFLETVESTNDLVDSLIKDLRSGVIDLATLKIRFEGLVANIEKVTSELDETKSDVIDLKLKVAILERSVQELEKLQIRDHGLKVVEKTGRWNVVVAIIAGTTALAVGIANIIIELLK